MKKEELNEFDQNMCEVLEIQLALESYQDNTGNHIELIDEAFFEIANLRKIKLELTESEKFKKSQELLVKLHRVLDQIGKEKFVFYDDGDIGYEWDMSLLEGGEKNGRK